MIVVVRPWKLLAQQMISVWFLGIPLTCSPHLRAALMAVSTASAPEFMGKIIGLPVRAASSW